MTRSWLAFVRVQATIVVIMLLSIVLVTLANIIFRTWGSGSITWADEFARVTFVMFSFLAAALACAFGAHLVVLGVADKTRGLLRRVLAAFQAFVAGAFFVSIMWIGYFQTIANLGQSTPAIGFPVAVIYGVVTFSGFLMLINSILASTVGATSIRDGRMELGSPVEDLEEIA